MLSRTPDPPFLKSTTGQRTLEWQSPVYKSTKNPYTQGSENIVEKGEQKILRARGPSHVLRDSVFYKMKDVHRGRKEGISRRIWGEEWGDE